MSSNYQPELNVYGYISLTSEKPTFVRVAQTFNLSVDPNDFDFILDDAVVIITDSNEMIYPGIGLEGYSHECTYSNGEPYFNNVGYSYIINESTSGDDFHADYDAIYNLSIEGPDNMVLTGWLQTPSEPIFNFTPEEIYPDSFFTISWQPPSEYTKVYVEVSSYFYSSIDCDNYYSYDNDTCYINRSETFANGETEWTTKIFSCLDNEYYNQNPDSIQISLTFMDLNYYDFFLKSSEDEFMNFMMGTLGNTQQSFGVEGGIGVFGSYVTKEITVPFNHSQ